MTDAGPEVDKMVKILHAADLHMDSPFAALPEEKAKLRRREQRQLLDKIAELSKNADIVLLAGDLFDSSASYWETTEALSSMLTAIKAEVFIAPGNHDYCASRSPYAFMELPENVHIFKTPQLRAVELPKLGVRVWGAGFTSGSCEGLLKNFTVPKSDYIELMVLHGDLAPESRYDPVTEADIAGSGLDYLALGHTHTYSGVKKAGGTFYAYPGCPEGRGFDETGPKGVITGTVSKGKVALEFTELPGRRYRIVEADLTGETDLSAAVKKAVGQGFPDDVVRLVLKGQYSGDVDTEALRQSLEDRFFHLTVKNELKKTRGIWDGAGDDTLTGLFLSKLREKYDEAGEDAESRELIELAARYGLAALESREEWRP